MGRKYKNKNTQIFLTKSIHLAISLAKVKKNLMLQNWLIDIILGIMLSADYLIYLVNL
jgi:hypothetical protein